MIRNLWQLDKDYKESCCEVLSENLSSLRAKAGITQEELANLIGVSRQTYHALELQKRELNWHTFLALLLFFDTNVETHQLLRNIDGAYPRELMRMMANPNG